MKTLVVLKTQIDILNLISHLILHLLEITKVSLQWITDKPLEVDLLFSFWSASFCPSQKVIHGLVLTSLSLTLTNIHSFLFHNVATFSSCLLSLFAIFLDGTLPSLTIYPELTWKSLPSTQWYCTSNPPASLPGLLNYKSPHPGPFSYSSFSPIADAWTLEAHDHGSFTLQKSSTFSWTFLDFCFHLM